MKYAALLLLPGILLTSLAAAEPSTLRFRGPGSSPVPAGWTVVAPDVVYEDGKGHGFGAGATLQPLPSGEGGWTSDAPFYFSARVPEGNYRVTVALGDPARPTVTTVKAELRRLMLERIPAAAGETVTCSFIVNVRTPALADGGRVRLNAPRESVTEAAAWDDRLTLEFNGSPVSVRSIQIEPVRVPTIFLLGDSTVADQHAEPYASWGQMLPVFFQPTVAVANHSESGESLAGATNKRRLDKVLSLLQPGDLLLIQFGHNDMKSKAPDALAQYRRSLESWVARIKKKGGTPVLITSVQRHSFQGRSMVNSLRDYPATVRDVAAREKIPLIDLHAMSQTLYEALGERGSSVLFKQDSDGRGFDHTHHNAYGAYELARCVVEGLRRAVPAWGSHLRTDLPPYDPAHPTPADQFQLPPSPMITTETPPGS